METQVCSDKNSWCLSIPSLCFVRFNDYRQFLPSIIYWKGFLLFLVSCGVGDVKKKKPSTQNVIKIHVISISTLPPYYRTAVTTNVFDSFMYLLVETRYRINQTKNVIWIVCKRKAQKDFLKIYLFHFYVSISFWCGCFLIHLLLITPNPIGHSNFKNVTRCQRDVTLKHKQRKVKQ